MGRRKAGQLLPLEIDILVEAIRLVTAGQTEFHGFGMASELRQGSQRETLIGHGTLYKALGRLEDSGLLSSRLEDPEAAAEAKRPRRRLYRITSAGRVAAAKGQTEPVRNEIGLLGPEPA